MMLLFLGDYLRKEKSYSIYSFFISISPFIFLSTCASVSYIYFITRVEIYFSDYSVQNFTLDERAVEPLDIVAIRVQDEDLITGDRHRK